MMTDNGVISKVDVLMYGVLSKADQRVPSVKFVGTNKCIIL